MKKSNKQIILDGAYRFVDFTRSYSIQEYTSNLLQLYGGVNKYEADKHASRYVRSTVSSLKQLNDELSRKGITKIGNLLPGNRITWLPSNQKQRDIWTYRPVVLDFIDSLSDDSFELLCCGVIRHLGGKAWKTKKKGDGNIDLYATLRNSNENHIFGLSNELKLVGQCKNYDHKEEVTKFESFYQALANVRHRSPRVANHIPADFSRTTGAIIGWYICKDGFQRGIYEEAHQHGILLSDKYDIAEILCSLPITGLSKFPLSLKLSLYRLINSAN